MPSTKRLFILARETPFLFKIFEGITSYSANHGQWEFYLGGHFVERLGYARRVLKDWKADGILCQIYNCDMESLVLRSKLPAVNFSGAMDVRVPTVRCDDVMMGQMAARYFLANGYRHFGFCAITGQGYSVRKCEGFSQELRSNGFDCRVFRHRWNKGAEIDSAATKRRMVKWLHALPKPAGILCIYDMLANEVATTCRHHGIRVPEEIAVLGTGNEVSVCNISKPPLSSIEGNYPDVGHEAARLMHRLIEGRVPPKNPILIPPGRIEVRQSSDMIAIEDPQIAEVMRYIRQHAHEPIDIKEILQEVPISRRAMERRFLRIVGRTPKEEINCIRMQIASGLLESTDLQMPAIANRSGFANPESFTRAFHREVGITPTEFRRKSRTGGQK